MCRWALDADGRFLFACGPTQPLFGHLPAALAGRRIAEVLAEDLAWHWMRHLRRAIAGERFLVHAAVRAEFTERVVAATQQRVHLVDPFDP